jgi:hypothetical protein
MGIEIIGGSYITVGGYGGLSNRKRPLLKKGEPLLPPAKELFRTPLRRYGRFDAYTRLGCAAVALALKDADIDRTEEKQTVGILLSTRYECMETDLAFYETTLEDGGKLSSPNLFSYTLPGIVMGECAAYFKLSGPTFTVTESDGRGICALKVALDLIESGTTETMIAGWLDSPPMSIASKDDEICGALLVVLTSRPEYKGSHALSYEENRILLNKKIEATSLVDLFGH